MNPVVLVILLPLICATPLHQKRLLFDPQQIDKLTENLRALVYPGISQEECVSSCRKIAGSLVFACDHGCTHLLKQQFAATTMTTTTTVIVI